MFNIQWRKHWDNKERNMEIREGKLQFKLYFFSSFVHVAIHIELMLSKFHVSRSFKISYILKHLYDLRSIPLTLNSCDKETAWRGSPFTWKHNSWQKETNSFNKVHWSFGASLHSTCCYTIQELLNAFPRALATSSALWLYMAFMNTHKENKKWRGRAGEESS